MKSQDHPPFSAAASATMRTYVGLTGLAVVAAALLVVPPAHSQVRLGNEAGGNYTVEVMSWWEIPFRSVIRQQYDFSCGSAALATLLTYHYDRPTPERATFSAMWKSGDQELIRKVGFSMFDMRAYLRSLGYRAEGYRLSQEDMVRLGRPSIVLLNLKGYKHFVVVKGIENGRILVGDSTFGLNQYALSDFMKAWNGIALVIVPEAGSSKPGFNLAGDWGPWSKAPLEDNALQVAAGNLTTHLPPSYQITPHLLLDVRVGTVR